MYEFIDTTQSSPTSNVLPAEAVQFDGKWLDRIIPGFRTLNVTGRETIGADFITREKPLSHGLRYIRRKYPPRTITVRYQLTAATPSAFRTAYNQLNAALDKENGKLIFNDESDKYFLGTREAMADPEPGLNQVTGEISFYCADPFKYSNSYTTATINKAVSGSISADTVVPVPAIIEITPSFNIITLTIQGLAKLSTTGADSPIKINNLKNGEKIIIDGETGLVTEAGANKFADMDFWEFPAIQPGTNLIAVTDSNNSTPQCNITIKYRSCYI